MRLLVLSLIFIVAAALTIGATLLASGYRDSDQSVISGLSADQCRVYCLKRVIPDRTLFRTAQARILAFSRLGYSVRVVGVIGSSDGSGWFMSVIEPPRAFYPLLMPVRVTLGYGPSTVVTDVIVQWDQRK
ncbi:MAG: hypothetical protein KF726_21420 [Anaerolineae bacterium]|nr:hypothetical protein [Anaerolineae bacterium]